MVKLTRNRPSKFYPGFIPIYGYMDSGVRNSEVGMRNAENKKRHKAVVAVI
jgi:hypothetical protein